MSYFRDLWESPTANWFNLTIVIFIAALALFALGVWVLGFMTLFSHLRWQ